jgi:ABC-type transport system involved in cytochrome c biogenesis permease component
VSAILALAALSLKLNFRNRMAILYGYLFPLIFLVAFWAIYRNDPVPLALHLGQLLTVTVLGTASLGLPTTIVSERERGVWRRYRLMPQPSYVFLASVLLARGVILVTSALLQMALGFAFGMPMPVHPAALALAFVVTSLAFMALGLVIAMLVDNVPAVQALGQCIFLPMLMIGGVAVSLQSLPSWAQHASVFFPGRYAVEALQSSVTGSGRAPFDLLMLLLIAAGGAIAAAGLFRWDKQFHPNKAWVGIAIAAWLVAGGIAEWRGRVVIEQPMDTQSVAPAKSFLAAKLASGTAVEKSWADVTEADFDKIAYDCLPLDTGIVAPVARSDEEPDPVIQPTLDGVQAALPDWVPGKVSDPLQRARNLLAVAAVPDILQMEQVERFVPRLVFARLQAVIPPRDLPKILYWIAMHPDDGQASATRELKPLGLPQLSGPDQKARGRVMLYAFKLLGRLTGHITP